MPTPPSLALARRQSTPRGRLGSRPLLAGALAMVVAVAVFTGVDNMLEQRLEDRARGRVLGELSTVRARLEGELNATIHLTMVMATYAGIHPDMGESEFRRVARELYRQRGDMIYNITLAPDNVIRFIYPIRGNQAVLGLNLETHPEQGESVHRMMQAADTVLAGPWKLVQGGEGLIIRTPVYLNSDRGRYDPEAYWGLTSIPIDMEAIYQITGLLDLEERLDIAIRGRDGRGPAGAVFFGDPELFTEDSLRQEVIIKGGRWELAARPKGGWAVVTTRPLAWHLTGIALVLTAGALAWRMAQQSERVRVSQASHQSLSERLRATIAAMPDICFILDAEGRYLEVFGGHDPDAYHTSHQALVGRTLHEVMPRDKADLFLARIHETLRTGKLQSIEYALSVEEVDGVEPESGPAGTQWFEGRLTPLGKHVMGRPAVIWLSVNITRRKKAQDNMRYMALHDALTGLANRTLLRDRMVHAIAQARREQSRIAVMYIDLDNFKPINDALGHDAGDTVLCEVAQRLNESVRDSDTVARVGGDEFVILLENLPEPELARGIGEKILEVLARPIQAKGRACTVTTSIGISVYPDHGETYESLLGAADQALYEAKSLGKNRYWQADASPIGISS